jgi:hypothetical protein
VHALSLLTYNPILKLVGTFEKLKVSLFNGGLYKSKKGINQKEEGELQTIVFKQVLQFKRLCCYLNMGSYKKGC